MTTAAEIRAARTRLKESQAAFGTRFGVSQPTIHGWETKGPPTRGAARFAIERLLAELRTKANAEPGVRRARSGSRAA